MANAELDNMDKKHVLAEYNLLPRKRHRDLPWVEERCNVLAVRPDGAEFQRISGAADLEWMNAVDELYFAHHEFLMNNTEPTKNTSQHKYWFRFQGLPWKKRPLTKYAVAVWHAARIGSLVAMDRLIDMLTSCEFYVELRFRRRVVTRVKKAQFCLIQRIARAVWRLTSSNLSHLTNSKANSSCSARFATLRKILPKVLIMQTRRDTAFLMSIGVFSPDHPFLPGMLENSKTVPANELLWVPSRWRDLNLTNLVVSNGYFLWVCVPKQKYLLPSWPELGSWSSTKARAQLGSDEYSGRASVLAALKQLSFTKIHHLDEADAAAYKYLHSSNSLSSDAATGTFTTKDNAVNQLITILSRVSKYREGTDHNQGQQEHEYNNMNESSFREWTQVPWPPLGDNTSDPSDFWMWQWQIQVWVYEESARFSGMARHYEYIYECDLVQRLLSLVPVFDLDIARIIACFILSPL